MLFLVASPSWLLRTIAYSSCCHPHCIISHFKTWWDNKHHTTPGESLHGVLTPSFQKRNFTRSFCYVLKWPLPAFSRDREDRALKPTTASLYTPCTREFFISFPPVRRIKPAHYLTNTLHSVPPSWPFSSVSLSPGFSRFSNSLLHMVLGQWSVWRAHRRETRSHRESMRRLCFSNLCMLCSAITALSTWCQGRLYFHMYML